MEKERRIKTLSLVALIVAVLGLTVAFAALSQTLTINGTASINSAEWDIHFENLSEAQIVGGASEISEPVLNGTTISNINVSLTKPGDSMTYEFDVINDGNIDAVISEVTIDFPEDDPDYETKYKQNYDWDGNGIVTDEELNKVQTTIDYTITYDGVTAPMANLSSSFKALLDGKELNKSDVKHVIFTIAYSSNATELPKKQIIDGPISFNINYSQK